MSGGAGPTFDAWPRWPDDPRAGEVVTIAPGVIRTRNARGTWDVSFTTNDIYVYGHEIHQIGSGPFPDGDFEVDPEAGNWPNPQA